MEKLVMALGPAFAAGFAVQRLLELLDPVFDAVESIKSAKKVVLGLVSLAFGVVLVFSFGLSVLQPLGINGSRILDGIVTALVVSAGTEGFNSILKFLGYAKENKKAEAAVRSSATSADAFKNLSRAV